jgi:RNA polymerase sigma-70 factor, ECF subfamily
MALVREGDASAFEVVFDRHSTAAFSLAYRMCGRRVLAEEIVQEAFLSIWRASASYDASRGSVKSWILGTVRNRAVDAFRRDAIRDAKTVGDDGISDRIESPERVDRTVEGRDEAQRVRGALGTLPDDQRRVIELAYFGGFSHSEIAAMLSLPAGTVKGRMRLGMSKLRIELGDLAGSLT